MASAYEVGTKAWQPDTAEGWVASELTKKTIDGATAKLVFTLENGEVCRVAPIRPAFRRSIPNAIFNV
jgi:myosin heavy subunit